MKANPNPRLKLKWWLAATAALCLGAASLGTMSLADENIGKVQQGLVGGKEVSERTQEALGLLTMRHSEGSCTASLLRNDWAILAAHCVEKEDADGDPIPDPNRPGQNLLVTVTKVKLTANWGGGQTQTAVRIETFRPYDVAIIELFDPIKVNNRTLGFARPVYTGSPTNLKIEYYGRGLSKFATGSGKSAIPSEFDGKFRMGEATVSDEEDTKFWYSGKNGEMTGGGDSGGPSFNGKGELVGVHSTARGQYIAGKPREWKWATKTTEASDAPIAPVWRQIAKIVGPVKSSTGAEPAPPPEPVFTYTVPFNTSSKPADFHILYGIKGDGTLMWHRHVIAPGTRRPHSWNPPKRVGDGWLAGFAGTYPAGQNGIYALADNGELKWYWHTGILDGSYRWRNDTGSLVGTGWNSYTKIIPMDKGVIYGILPDGTLRWQKHLNYMTGLGGTTAAAWSEGKIVHSGFDKYKTVFGGGNGILYAVGQDNVLYWFRHKNYLDRPSVAPVSLPKGLPAKLVDTLTRQWNNSWEGPKRVGDGWDFIHLTSAGEGHIYGVLPNGDLMYYKHLGWQTGQYAWDEKISGKIATGWNAYVRVFARNDTSDAGSKNPEVDFIQPK